MERITLELPAPYVGLRPFGEDDALLFFGRDAHVRALLRKFAQQRFTAVIGVSGSGKSSLVRAGLIPALHGGELSSEGHRWNTYTFKPGNGPLASLAKELVRDARWVGASDDAAAHYLTHTLAASPLALVEMYRKAQKRFENEAVLLVVDQFEEIFRYRQGKETEPLNPRDHRYIDEAEAFVKLLLRSASEPGAPLYVLITMRSDFLGQCSVFYGLPEAINSGIYLTPRLDRDQLSSVIASPLTLVGGGIAGALVAHLINTLGDQDELPVLEHALLRMWKHARSQGRTQLDDADFKAVCRPRQAAGPKHDAHSAQGGPPHLATEPALIHALDHHASEIYERLTPEQQRIARRVFLALSERRERQHVRRPQHLSELLDQIGQVCRDDILAMLDAFSAEGVGFLMPPLQEPIADDTFIDIRHESLIRQWRLFQQWLGEEEADVADLREWQQRAGRNLRSGGGWLDESDIARAQRWLRDIESRGNPKAWLTRYTRGSTVGSDQVFDYVYESRRRVYAAARDERQRLDLWAQIERLEAQASAQASARGNRRATRVAIASTVVMGLVAAFVTWLWLEDVTIEHGRAKVLAWLHRYQVEPEMVEVPKGSFQMGDVQGTGGDNEKPVRTVEFKKPFAIGKYEVSFAEYDRYLYAQGIKERNFPSDQGWGRGRRPVINVSWGDAMVYMAWLSEQTGEDYRLPTEAEWEYAARGGTNKDYWWDSNEMEPGMANCFGCGSEWDGKSAPIGSFKPNPYGVYDTVGNVWEWVQDCYHENYEDAPTDSSAWQDTEGCSQRVSRGGSWLNAPRYLRSAFRYANDPGKRSDFIGFRLAQDLD